MTRVDKIATVIKIGFSFFIARLDITGVGANSQSHEIDSFADAENGRKSFRALEEK